MIHRGIKVAYVAMTVLSAVLAFIVLRNADEEAMFGAPYHVGIFDNESGVAPERVGKALTAFAREHDVNVGRWTAAPRDGTRHVVYLAVGAPDAESTRWMRDGYPSFSRNPTVADILPYRDIPDIDPTGYYLVYGSERHAEALQRELGALGLRGEVAPWFTIGNTLRELANGALLYCFLVVGLVVVLSVASAVVLNARAYGIQRLQRNAFAAILWRDLRRLGRFFAAGTVAVGACALSFLYWYNGWNQLGIYAIGAVLLLGAYACLALATHVVTLALVHRGAILPAVKGEVTAGWAVVGSYALRAATVVLALVIGTYSIFSGFEVDQQRARYETWAAQEDAYYLGIGNSAGGSRNSTQIMDRLARWVREADARGQILYAAASSPGRVAPALDGDRPASLVVNNRYLREQEVLAPGGERVRPAANENVVRVLIPGQYWGHSVRIEQGIREWLRFQARSGPVPEMRLERVASGQSLFTYASPTSPVERLFLQDPVLVVATGASGAISGVTYASDVTQQAVMVDDRAKARASLAEAGLDRYVIMIGSKTQEQADADRVAAREFRLAAFDLMAALAVLLLTAVSVSIVYVRRNAQALFVKYISGWTFVRTHAWLLAVETTLAVALVGWTWQRTAVLLARANHPNAPPSADRALLLDGWEPLVAAGIAVLSTALIVAVLARTNRRFVEAHSATLS